MKHTLILPDGSRLSSGPGTVSAIKSVTLTHCVNDGSQLTPGSALAAELDVSVFTPGGSLDLTAGQEVRLLRTDDTGSEQPLGIFLLEQPTRTSLNTMRLTGFDRLVKLDKDLTQWLAGLTGWPYPLLTFAKMVCAACGVTLVTEDVPNGDYPIARFSRPGVTGRQLIRWLGEIACRFCTANEAGELEFGWYTDSGVRLTPTGDRFYFQSGLRYEDYTTQAVDAVQLRLGEGEQGYLWPPAAADANCYILSGNPLLSSVTDRTEAVLQTIARELSGLSYTPCKVTVPAMPELRAGSRFTVTTPGGSVFSALVMTRTATGQKTTLESTGSPRRSTADKSLGQLIRETADTAESNAVSAAAGDAAAKANAAQANAISAAAADASNKANAALSSAKSYADTAAAGAVNAQTQADIFNRLTANGTLPGLYMEDGQLYINASYLKSGIIDAAVVQVVNLIAERLKSVSDFSELDIDGASINLSCPFGETYGVQNYDDGTAYVYFTQYNEDGTEKGHSQFGANVMQIGGTWADPILAFYVVDGVPSMQIGDSRARTISWKANGDGTFTLIGT